MTMQHFDLIIRNATVIDGTKAPRLPRRHRRARRPHRGDRRARRRARPTPRSTRSGLVAAPGFIDAHTHDDRLLLSDRDVTPKVSQGVTTVITGNCGISLAHSPRAARRARRRRSICSTPKAAGSGSRAFAPIARRSKREPAAINAACLVGHTTFRVATMDRLDRVATAAEIAKMREMARESLASGAIGISTGTAYPPAACASTEEIIEVCRPLARARRPLRHAHAQRRRRDHRFDGGDVRASAARSTRRSSSRITSASARATTAARRRRSR